MNIENQMFFRRGPLPQGCSSFAGFEARVDMVLSTLAAPDGANSVSIVGPKRSGKSSLLQQLSTSGALARYVSLADATLVHADFRQYKGEANGGIQYLIRCIAEAVELTGFSGKAVRAATTMTAAVKGALQVLPGRLFVLIDDFEFVGSDLRKDDQADLRNAVYKIPLAAYVVATRLPLANCLEEFGDDLSDFAPVCGALPGVLAQLNQSQIAEMVSRSVKLAPAQAHAIAQLVHNKVGGFPLWVQQALGIIFMPGTSWNWPTILAESEGRLDDEWISLAQSDLKQSFRSLSGVAQRTLESAGVESSPAAIRELNQAGWITRGTGPFSFSGTLISRWFREAAEGESLDPVVDGDDPYDQLVAIVERLNKKHRLLTHKGNVLRTDVFSQSSDVPFLRREVKNADDFGRRILSLARLVYEGSGGGVRGGKLTLPAECYANERCVVFQLTRLRHAFVHLEHPESETSTRGLEQEAFIYRSYISKSAPENIEDYQLAARLLMDETIRFLGELCKVVPFAADLRIDSLLPA